MERVVAIAIGVVVGIGELDIGLRSRSVVWAFVGKVSLLAAFVAFDLG